STRLRSLRLTSTCTCTPTCRRTSTRATKGLIIIYVRTRLTKLQVFPPRCIILHPPIALCHQPVGSKQVCASGVVVREPVEGNCTGIGAVEIRSRADGGGKKAVASGAISGLLLVWFFRGKS